MIEDSLSNPYRSPVTKPEQVDRRTVANSESNDPNNKRPLLKLLLVVPSVVLAACLAIIVGISCSCELVTCAVAAVCGSPVVIVLLGAFVGMEWLTPRIWLKYVVFGVPAFAITLVSAYQAIEGIEHELIPDLMQADSIVFPAMSLMSLLLLHLLHQRFST